MMSNYTVVVNGTFNAIVEVSIDDDTPEDNVEEIVFGLAEKQLNDMVAKKDYSLLDDIEFECIDYNEA
jgi:hypothetical protein